MAGNRTPTLGVVIVTYRSQDVIAECLETLAGSQGVELKIVVVDNASPDATRKTISDWASGAVPFIHPKNSPLPDRQVIAKPIALEELEESECGKPLGRLTLIQSKTNRGFAGGVNVGLTALRNQVDWYWILNPDCAVPDGTAREYVERAEASPEFALMSCRTLYYDHPDRIQTAGGRVDRLTGVCRQRSFNALVDAPPDTGDLDWVTGANMLASAKFIERVGLMREDYFLYYEEVDWAFRRQGLPIIFLQEPVVYHRGGTSIGTGSIDRRPSAFANYFNHRNRIRFARRFLYRWPLAAYAYGIAKAAQLLLIGAVEEAHAVVAGMFELNPPRTVKAKLGDANAAELAFGPATP